MTIVKTQTQGILLYAVTSVHPGSGSEVGFVDLPIQREKHTRFPKIEGSSLKGAIRAAAREATGDSEEEKRKLALVFGGEPRDREEPSAGAITLTDARVLLFPVRSMRRVFVWITCPFVLERFNREVAAYRDSYGRDASGRQQWPALPVPEPGCVSSADMLIGPGDKQSDKGRLVLAEYTFSDCRVDEQAKRLAERLEQWLGEDQKGRVVARLAVVSDEDFADFVQLATEVQARIRIDDDKGTVAAGGLWYEEHVPPETVFYAYLFAFDSIKAAFMDADGKKREVSMSAEEVMQYLKDPQRVPDVFQLGGNSSVGRGMLRKTWF